MTDYREFKNEFDIDLVRAKSIFEAMERHMEYMLENLDQCLIETAQLAFLNLNIHEKFNAFMDKANSKIMVKRRNEDAKRRN